MTTPKQEAIDWEKTPKSSVAQPKETVNHPSHYNQGKIEVIDAIEDWKLGFNDGNAVKYIARHAYKGNAKEDLKKALWYVARELRSKYGVPSVELIMIISAVVKGDHGAHPNS